jgi:hypothetical protein
MLRDASRVRVNPPVEQRQGLVVCSREEVPVKKRLVVATLVVVCVGLACSAATKTFTNTTGQAATQIVVTFSEEVRVTSYTSDVFPTQSPASGESESFTFSGGTLDAGGTFQVTWSPSSARVRSTKWIMSGSAAVATASVPSIPTTYEEIMAQIAHYPGPDEPLYVPAEGEQIWLTDLDGHVDIYDNDSIRINYAPGFDKSQIMRIEVYRNGIKMRFLPEKLDVLTNDQMKTFDGNPAERTPKSSHTDHAIFGYEYEFRLFRSSGANVTVVAKEVKNPFHLDFEEVWAALDGGWMHSLQYLGEEDLGSFFRRLKQDGFTGIKMDFATFVDSPTASDVWMLDHEDSALSLYWSVRTASKADFDRVLDAIDRAGLAANVVGQAYISMKYPRDQFIYSANIRPGNPKQYLESCLAIWRGYMPLFEQHRVALVTPFREMDGIIQRTEEIKWFYDQLSVGFSGRLSCETSTANYLLGWSPNQEGRSFAQMAPSFWDWRDPQGRPLVNELDVWHVPLSADKDQRYSRMIIPFVQFLAPAVDFYRTRYPENPLMYGELGAFDIDGYCTGTPINDIEPRVYDEQETADMWAAFLIGIRLQGIRSVSVFDIPIGNLARNDEPGWLFINLNSSTYRVITSLLGTDGTT